MELKHAKYSDGNSCVGLLQAIAVGWIFFAVLFAFFYTNSYKMRIDKKHDVWRVHFYLNCNFEFRNANRQKVSFMGKVFLLNFPWEFIRNFCIPVMYSSCFEMQFEIKRL